MSQLYVRETGSGAPLLLLHGLMATGDMFAPISDQLAARHRLIVPDLRGHGRSADLPAPYTVKAMAGDLAGLLDRLGVERADVLGYSHGGAVAQQFAIEHGARVRRLVLVCTYAHNALTQREQFENRLTPWLIRLLGPRRLAAVMLRTNAGGGPPMAPAQVEQFVAMLGSNRKANMLAAARDLNTFDSRPHLKTVQAPTLVVAGEADQAVPMAHARMLADLIPNATLRVVAGAGHTLMWTHPAVLAEIIEPWLAS